MLANACLANSQLSEVCSCLSEFALHNPVLPGEEKEILVEHDDGIRADISTAALSKLKPVFKKDGSTTAGNSSQVRLSMHQSHGC